MLDRQTALTNFFIFGILWPWVGGPFVLVLNHVLEPGLDQSLSMLQRRVDRGTKFGCPFMEQLAPFAQGAVFPEATVVGAQRADSFTHLNVASGVQVLVRLTDELVPVLDGAVQIAQVYKVEGLDIRPLRFEVVDKELDIWRNT